MRYKSGANMVFSAKYHVVFCPKYRFGVLRGNVESRFKEILGDVAREHAVDVLASEVMPDHVHLLIEVNPHFGIPRFIGLLKGRTSRVLRKEHPSLRSLPSLWTNSCFIATVGGAPLSVVKQYVENQKVR